MAADRPSGDFGGKLRTARERRGISLRQIASATKISVAALEALERNDISRLPGGIFSRAFVRSYASEVGLDPEATIQDFIAQFPQDSVTAGQPTSGPVDDNQANEGNRRMASTFLGLLALSVPLAGALVYFGTAGWRATPNETPVAVTSPAAESTPSVPAPAAPSSEASTSAAAPSAPAVPQPAVTPAAGDRFTVGLSVKRPCWVSATVDGRRTIDQLLEPGRQRTIEVRREMVLTAGDASAITLTLNGAEARPLGNAGEVVTTRLTLANFTTYVPRR